MVTIEIFYRGDEFPRYERTYVGPGELLAADVAGILVVILRGPVKFLDGVIELQDTAWWMGKWSQRRWPLVYRQE